MLSSGKQNTDNYIIKCHQAQESENASSVDKPDEVDVMVEGLPVWYHDNNHSIKEGQGEQCDSGGSKRYRFGSKIM